MKSLDSTVPSHCCLLLYDTNWLAVANRDQSDSNISNPQDFMSFALLTTTLLIC